MEQMAGTVEAEAPELERTTVGAYWVDAGKIRELKKKRRTELHSQADALRFLVQYYEAREGPIIAQPPTQVLSASKGSEGKEESGHGDGVQSV